MATDPIGRILKSFNPTVNQPSNAKDAAANEPSPLAVRTPPQSLLQANADAFRPKPDTFGTGALLMASNPVRQNPIARGIEEKISSGVGDVLGKVGSALRSKNLFGLLDNKKKGSAVKADLTAITQSDWRVRLSFPPGNPNFATSGILAPLVETNNSMIFPYTPSVTISHTANYNALSPAHSNYQFMSYENSQVDVITVTGEFLVETPSDAAYWIGAKHFLQSITKMSYGDTSNAGSPPPVVRLNGYGSHVFDNVPVVVTNFTVDLPNDVDYIRANVSGTAYAPTRSTITVSLQVVYSREQVRNFSLDDFINGKYIFDGNGFI